MKVFTTFYEEKSQELERRHNEWVNSNKKMRSLELAARQIRTEGDIQMTPVEDILKKEYEKEKLRNDKLCANAYALKDFVRCMEIEAKKHGVDWNKVEEIFGY